MIISKKLINILEQKILEHPDAQKDNRYPSFQRFFEGEQWTNTWFSEVVRGKRDRITPKFRALCTYLNIEIEDYL